MKKCFILNALSVILSVNAFTQSSGNLPELSPLSETELQKLASYPEYFVNNGDQPFTMPFSVDNTLQPYFRPLFNQSGLECGQAASIGLNFTYEMDWKRNLPANTSQNQYATHFTYDFINGGSDAGVSYFESWEIVKRCGNPTVFDYGGLSSGGASRWMTGYDYYYNAMHNRITDVYTISTPDETGLNKLKNWIYNHSNTSAVGGLANIYIQYKTPDAQLAAGTPEAGKWVITTWGGSPNHAVTLVGYNDSIRYDYNNDGIYTNNIDINGDGVVNMKDWEIGGFKLANTYGGINNWGDLGFSYVMYKTFADDLGSGGIWNHAAHIIKVKADVTPKLTFKITLKHTSRNKLKIMAGVSQNPLAAEPDAILNLPIFDMQGGDKYMLGGSNEADKTIVFGLDVTPLLSNIEPGQPAKFFLMLSENDPMAVATGEVISLDLVDYTGITTTIPCNSSNIPIVENGLTTLTITYTPNHNKPAITSTILPEAKIYEPYSQQLNASGGTPAYKWKFLNDYTESPFASTFPSVTAQQLSISNTSNGFAEIDLPFGFLFFGKKYTKLYAHVDGYLMFEPDLMPWPFIIYEKTFFKNTRNISPYMSKPLVLNPSEGDGIWYEGNQDYAIFRWKESMYGSGPTTDLNYAVKIFPDGKIEFYYGSIASNSWVGWNAGISNGDGVNYRYCSITDSLAQPVSGSMFRFTTLPSPPEMSISEDGIFSGTPAEAYSNIPLKFYAEDNNLIFCTKTLGFSTKGIKLEYIVNSGGDSILEYAEDALITAKLTNIGSSVLHDVNLKLLISDPYIVLTDSTQNIGTLNPGQTLIVPDALSFHISEDVPDEHLISATNQAIAAEDIFTRIIPLKAYSPALKIAGVSIQDGNDNILMPGENATLHITIRNDGGSAAANIQALLTAIDPMIIITQGTGSIAQLPANSIQTIDFQVSVIPACPLAHISMAALNLSADLNYSANDSVYFVIGIIAEDFETSDFLRYPWHFSGNANWIISTNLPYQGSFCASSPALLDNMQSSMYVSMNVLSESQISFYRKVSSETNYDFLTFYIDGAEQGKWSGEVPWGKITYNVTAGQHIFTWRYNKDINTIGGSDKAWVDYIVWPPNEDLLLIANAGPDGTTCYPSAYPLYAVAVNAEYLSWTTSGDGYFDNYNSPQTNYFPGIYDLNLGSVILTLHAGKTGSQTVTDNLTLTVSPLPFASAGPDAVICSGNELSLGGSVTWSLPFQWNTSGDGTFNNSSILSPVYTPGPTDILNGEVILSLTAFGTLQCGNSTDTLVLSINPAVYSNAGPDQTIPYGTYTQLFGQASGGTGQISVHWEPADKLVNADTLNPTTLSLTGLEEFVLQVFDPVTQCSSTDYMVVYVTGGPLTVVLHADPDEICLGGETQLNAVAGGGTGNYTYSWSSIPPGFSSAIANPVVTPVMSTQYTVEVSDGSNYQQMSVTVTVDSTASAPQKPEGPSQVNSFLSPVSQYSTEPVPDANDYQWVIVPTSAGIIVQNANTCEITWNGLFNGIASLEVVGKNACGVGNFSESLLISASPFIGLPDQPAENRLKVWPNPSKGIFKFETANQGRCVLTITNSQGKQIMRTEYETLPEIATINLSGFAAGIYLLSLENESGNQTQRLVISK